MVDQFSDREWFAVVVKSGKHQFAAEQLERQGYRSFLPMCLVERTHARKVETVTRPLFGRYQFVGVHSEQPFGPIGNTMGVDFVVRGSGGIPVRVSPLALRRVLKRCLADGGAVDLRPVRTTSGPIVDWEPGDALQVIEGPFRDFSAVLVEWADKRREMARVMVHLFGRQMRAELTVKCLLKADQSGPAEPEGWTMRR